ncbi:hypothetical protein H9P43_006502 [Blastocladiella emersonii ATCC 22665]|nr:hypothetical protein H9P43_006502 [Blastocladiella emersonii ATCC 22665]
MGTPLPAPTLTTLPLDIIWLLHLYLLPGDAAALRRTCRALSEFPMAAYLDLRVARYAAQWPDPVKADLAESLIERVFLAARRFDPAWERHWVPQVIAGRGYASALRTLLSLRGPPWPGLLTHATAAYLARRPAPATDLAWVATWDAGDADTWRACFTILATDPRTSPGAGLALDLAIVGGHLGLVHLLLRTPGAIPPARRGRALRVAAQTGRWPVVCALLREHAADMDPRADGYAAVHVALTRGHAAAAVALLSDARVDRSAGDGAFLRAAARGGMVEVVRVLVDDPRVDPGADDCAALQEAADAGHAEIVRVLLATGRVDPTANAQFALQLACLHGHEEVVRELLAHPKVDPSADGNAAAVMAVRHGHTEMVKVLMESPRFRIEVPREARPGTGSRMQQ